VARTCPYVPSDIVSLTRASNTGFREDRHGMMGATARRCEFPASVIPYTPVEISLLGISIPAT